MKTVRSGRGKQTQHSLGWLHLTDLHIGQPREGGRSANVERALFDDLARTMRDRRQTIRIIFFTGDIAFRGSEQEYVRATALLGRLCHHVRDLNKELKVEGDPFPILVPVPGNHDLARPDQDTIKTIQAAFAGRTPGSPPLWQPAQSGVRELIEKAFAGYSTWLRRHPLPFPPGMVHGVLPGDIRATIERDGIRVGVIGLNMSYLHFGDDAAGTLHVDQSQLANLVKAVGEWIDSHDCCVLLTHHPPSWLTKVGREILDSEIKPDSMFDLHLFGHEHVGSHRREPGSAGVRHLIEGRSLFAAEEQGSPRLHGYGIGTFHREDKPQREGKPGSATRFLRVHTREGYADGDHGWRFGPVDSRFGNWHVEINQGASPKPLRPKELADTPPAKLPPGFRDLAEGRANWHRITEPGELARLLTKEYPERSWILLSASIPSLRSDKERAKKEKHYIDSARPTAILGFVQRLVRAIGNAKPKDGPDVGIVCGGHPSMTEALAPTLLEADRKDGWFVLVQDEHYWPQRVEEVSVIATAPQVTPVLVSTAGNGPALELMRTSMVSPKDLRAAVFVGGMAGVVTEFEIAGKEKPNVPRYCVGLGGGAAAELLLDPRTADQALGAVPGQKTKIEVAAKLWHTPEVAVDAVLQALGVMGPR